MPGSPSLETILVVITASVVMADIILALCLSMILPRYVLEQDKYVYQHKEYDHAAIWEECECWMYQTERTYTPSSGTTEETTPTFHSSTTQETTPTIHSSTTGETTPTIHSSTTEETTPTVKSSTTEKTTPTVKSSTTENPSMDAFTTYELYPRAVRNRVSRTRRPRRGTAQNQTLLQNNENIFENNPYLVSMSIPSYSDEVNSWMFACTGIILSQKYVLASANCVKNRFDYLHLLVRSGSPSSSEFGTVHEVMEVLESPIEDLVVLEITPRFFWGQLVRPVSLPETSGQWTSATTAEWVYEQVSYSPNDAIQGRSKHKKLDMTSYTTTECSASRISYVCKSLDSSASDCDARRVTSSPLISSCGKLIGLKIENCNLFLDVFSKKLIGFISGFIEEQDSEIYSKEGSDCITMYENRCGWKSQDVCRSVLPLNVGN